MPTAKKSGHTGKVTLARSHWQGHTGKVKLSKVTQHEHNLLHTMFIAERKGLLNAFTHNLEHMHGGLDFADLLLKQQNLTIFSAFPWAQTGEESTWKQLKNDIAVSAQYPEYRGKQDDND